MALSLNETTLLNAISGGGLLSVINSSLSPSYGVYYSPLTTTKSKASSYALEPTSFIDVSRVKEASITTAPLEKGDYESYNKVQRPAEINAIVVFEGWTGFSGSVPNLTNFTTSSRTEFLATLDKMISSTEIYDIETPDTTYESYDLSRYDYKVNSQDGITLLTVNLVFQAVQVTAKSNKVDPSQDTKSPNLITQDGGRAGTSDATLNEVNAAIASIKKQIPAAATKVATTVEKAVLGQGGKAQLDAAVKELVGLLQ
ncbi:Uncharacterised protein [Serratia quinivorans]|uniref:phage baseplate protein n=1 Tax=Serratia TaxID=613 RepID=UPI00217B2BA3|nr:MULTISPECIES: hypothetical protein [Serratia]CAI0970721.1 Uncharacterised protein [Serratia quinivorans]CAI0986848.1 Uncharacterised protein [Serratia quinivorans]CAI1777113.1 Uncharacterised protein [Serratia quinivorans]CAI2105599.1 Uncharacterised protein [Serratia quinivorans]CAI2463181.1 Uncharacterised protein [Serratia quinivorans]